MAAALRNEIATQFQTSTPVFLQAVFLIYGVFFALQSGNPAAPGAILAIYYFVPEAVSPLQEIIQFFAGLQSNWPQVEKVVEILEAEPEVQEQPGAVALVPSQGALGLENLTFAYSPDGQKILDDLSYSFAPGQVTAIVARAGMGKSTLLNLVARLRDPQGGRILVDDQDIGAVTLASLRRQVAKVSQFPLFMADTIRTNFKLANDQASDAELEEVCRRTGLWQVLENAAGPHSHPLDYSCPGPAAKAFPAANAVSWRSPGPFCCTPPSCCSMSPPPASTPSGGPKWPRSCGRLAGGSRSSWWITIWSLSPILPIGSAAWSTASLKRWGPRKNWRAGRDYSGICSRGSPKNNMLRRLNRAPELPHDLMDGIISIPNLSHEFN